MTDATATTTTPASGATPSTSAAPAVAAVSPPSTQTASPSADSFVSVTAPAAVTPPVTPPAVTAPARPDWLPEKLWDAEKGAKADDIKAALTEAETFRAARAALPKTAAEYKPELPAGVKMPDGASIDVNNPLFKSLQETAHAEGWSQAAFSKTLNLEMQRAISQHALIQRAISDRDAALGANGPARVDAVTSFMKTIAPSDKVAGELAKMLVTPGIIETFERIQLALGSQGIGSLTRAGGTGPAKTPGKIEGYEKMSFSQKLAAAGHA